MAELSWRALHKRGVMSCWPVIGDPERPEMECIVVTSRGCLSTIHTLARLIGVLTGKNKGTHQLPFFVPSFIIDRWEARRHVKNKNKVWPLQEKPQMILLQHNIINLILFCRRTFLFSTPSIRLITAYQLAASFTLNRLFAVEEYSVWGGVFSVFYFYILYPVKSRSLTDASMETEGSIYALWPKCKPMWGVRVREGATLGSPNVDARRGLRINTV